MKSICITGAVQSDLQTVANILQQAGMKQPEPARRDNDSIDIRFWHKQIMALAVEDSGTIQPILNPGRLWEQLASDIFIANIKSNIWGWSDTHSTWLLDYWLDFEPRLNFILVCVSPQQMLASAMVSETEEISIERVMTGWQVYHQELLRFHHRNPHRSLLIDFRDCVNHPENLIERCVEQWRLPLTKPIDTTYFERSHDSLTLYLAQQLCQNYSQVASLQHELTATVTRLNEADQAAPTMVLAPPQIVAGYRALRDRSAELQQVKTANEELAALKTQFDDAVASHARQQRDTDAKLKESAQENELLLLQLHQVQEELEAISLKHKSQQVQTDISTQFNFKETAQENELLLLQLHQVQEELEHYFLQHQDKQKELQIAEARWQRLLQRNPAYLDYETIEILPAPGKDDAIAWRLTNLSAAGRHFPILEFKTPLECGVAGLIFSRSVEGNHLLTRWPATANQQNELILMPAGTTATLQQRAETLLDLATSDWSLLQVLTAQLIETLASSTILKERTDFQPDAFRAGLEKFGQILQKFPPTLRYDQVQLKREQINPDYEHLWLHFDNLSFSGKRWPEFEFRLACANVQPGRFGFHPKLEFPEKGGQAPFETWFIESSDDFGAKLELRFAQPDAMDMAIWSRLTEQDRLFLAALIKRLPAILGTLQSLNVQLKRPWADWNKMVRGIQRIVALRTAVPPAPVPVVPVQPTAPEVSTSLSKKPKQPLDLPDTIKTAERSLSKKPVSKTKTAKPTITSETRKV